MSIAQLIDPIGPQEGPAHLPTHGDWLQGRTLYGGASALLAYTTAVRAFPDLPPLRAAQIAFVAPTGPDIEVRREIVRQGRNVAHVRSEIWCEGKCATTAFFIFGTQREPNAVHAAAPVEEWPGSPDETETLNTHKAPTFLKTNFEIKRAQEARGPGDPVVRRWARLQQPTGLDPISELILLGDVLPPGAMRAMQRQGPISSINWSFNVLDPNPRTQDGWWLTQNASQHADQGYSSERLRLWNTDGQQVVEGLQSVAVFG